MIVDLIVVILFLKILIKIIKRIGIDKFVVASLIIVLFYCVMRFAGKEIDVSYYFGVIVTSSLAVISYETFKNFSHYESHRKSIAVGLFFILQIVTSYFLLLYVIRKISDVISFLSFSENMLLYITAILNWGGSVFSIPLDSILAIISLAAFLVMQQIRKMH